jgi:hypothetical protein
MVMPATTQPGFTKLSSDAQKSPTSKAMKTQPWRAPLHTTIAVLLAIGASPLATAGSVTDLSLSGEGIPYRKLVTLNPLDSAAFNRHVGAWSWQDSSLFGPGEDPVGWTHTSDWAKITLTAPASLTIRMERQEGVQVDPVTVASTSSMFPSFTLLSGWDTDGDQVHMYNNDGVIAWAEDVTYLAHFANSTESFIEFTIPDLAAGNYTIALGSFAPSSDTARQGYRATFTTAVPEPGSTLLLTLVSGALASRRRRRNAATI